MNRKKKILWGILVFITLSMLIPQALKMPVVGADSNSYNHKTFWYYPWGSSVVHKGIDVFAKKETSIHSATIELVLYTGTAGKGGNAKTTPAYLHYGIGTLIPYLWRIDDAPLGWQKSFYLNPIDYL